MSADFDPPHDLSARLTESTDCGSDDRPLQLRTMRQQRRIRVRRRINPHSAGSAGTVRLSVLALAFAFAFACLVSVAHAATWTVLCPAGGSWDNPATWNTGVVPGPGIDVIINDGCPVTASSSPSISIQSLQVGSGGGSASLTLSAATTAFNVANQLTTMGVCTITINAAATMKLSDGSGTPSVLSDQVTLVGGTYNFVGATSTLSSTASITVTGIFSIFNMAAGAILTTVTAATSVTFKTGTVSGTVNLATTSALALVQGVSTTATFAIVGASGTLTLGACTIDSTASFGIASIIGPQATTTVNWYSPLTIPTIQVGAFVGTLQLLGTGPYVLTNAPLAAGATLIGSATSPCSGLIRPGTGTSTTIGVNVPTGTTLTITPQIGTAILIADITTQGSASVTWSAASTVLRGVYTLGGTTPTLTFALLSAIATTTTLTIAAASVSTASIVLNTLTVSGTLDVQGGTVTATGTLSGGGVINYNGCTVNLGITGTYTGVINGPATGVTTTLTAPLAGMRFASVAGTIRLVGTLAVPFTALVVSPNSAATLIGLAGVQTSGVWTIPATSSLTTGTLTISATTTIVGATGSVFNPTAGFTLVTTAGLSFAGSTGVTLCSTGAALAPPYACTITGGTTGAITLVAVTVPATASVTFTAVPGVVLAAGSMTSNGNTTFAGGITLGSGTIGGTGAVTLAQCVVSATAVIATATAYGPAPTFQVSVTCGATIPALQYWGGTVLLVVGTGTTTPLNTNWIATSPTTRLTPVAGCLPSGSIGVAAGATLTISTYSHVTGVSLSIVGLGPSASFIAGAPGHTFVGSSSLSFASSLYPIGISGTFTFSPSGTSVLNLGSFAVINAAATIAGTTASNQIILGTSTTVASAITFTVGAGTIQSGGSIVGAGTLALGACTVNPSVDLLTTSVTAPTLGITTLTAPLVIPLLTGITGTLLLMGTGTVSLPNAVSASTTGRVTGNSLGASLNAILSVPAGGFTFITTQSIGPDAVTITGVGSTSVVAFSAAPNGYKLFGSTLTVLNAAVTGVITSDATSNVVLQPVTVIGPAAFSLIGTFGASVLVSTLSVTGTGAVIAFSNMEVLGGTIAFPATANTLQLSSGVIINGTVTITGTAGTITGVPAIDCTVIDGAVLNIWGGAVSAGGLITGPGTVNLQTTNIGSSITTQFVNGPPATFTTTLTAPITLSAFSNWAGTCTIAGAGAVNFVSAVVTASTARLSSGGANGPAGAINITAGVTLTATAITIFTSQSLSIASVGGSAGFVGTAVGFSASNSALSFASTLTPITVAGTYTFAAAGTSTLSFGPLVTIAAATTVAGATATNRLIFGTGPGTTVATSVTLTLNFGYLFSGAIVGAGTVVLGSCTVGTGVQLLTASVLGPTNAQTTTFVAPLTVPLLTNIAGTLQLAGSGSVVFTSATVVAAVTPRVSGTASTSLGGTFNLPACTFTFVTVTTFAPDSLLLIGLGLTSIWSAVNYQLFGGGVVLNNIYPLGGTFILPDATSTVAFAPAIIATGATVYVNGYTGAQFSSTTTTFVTSAALVLTNMIVTGATMAMSITTPGTLTFTSGVRLSGLLTINGVGTNTFDPGPDMIIDDGSVLQMNGPRIANGGSITGLGAINLAAAMSCGSSLYSQNITGPSAVGMTLTVTNPLTFGSMNNWIGQILINGGVTGVVQIATATVTGSGARLTGVATATIYGSMNISSAAKMTFATVNISPGSTLLINGAINSELVGGTIAMAAGSTLSFAGSAGIAVSGTFNGGGSTGTIAFQSTSVVLPGISISGAVGYQIVVLGGIPLNVGTLLTLTGGTLASGPVVGAGQVTLSGCTVAANVSISTGTILGPASAIITTLTGPLTLPSLSAWIGIVQLAGSGVVAITAAGIQAATSTKLVGATGVAIAGVFTVPATSVFTFQSVALAQSAVTINGFVGAGFLTTLGCTLVSSSLTITQVYTNGLFALDGTSVFNFGPSVVINAGTTLAIQAQTGSVVSSSSTITLLTAASKLDFTGSTGVSLSGAITIACGTTSVVTFVGATLTPGSTLAVNGVVGNLVNTGNFVVAAGASLGFNALITVSTGSISGPGAVALNCCTITAAVSISTSVITGPVLGLVTTLTGPNTLPTLTAWQGQLKLAGSNVVTVGNAVADGAGCNLLGVVGVSFNGNITVPSGQTLTFSGVNILLGGSVNVFGPGAFVAGTVTFGGSSSMLVSGPINTHSGVFTFNAGATGTLMYLGAITFNAATTVTGATTASFAASASMVVGPVIVLTISGTTVTSGSFTGATGVIALGACVIAPGVVLNPLTVNGPLLGVTTVITAPNVFPKISSLAGTLQLAGAGVITITAGAFATNAFIIGTALPGASFPVSLSGSITVAATRTLTCTGFTVSGAGAPLTLIGAATTAVMAFTNVNVTTSGSLTLSLISMRGVVSIDPTSAVTLTAAAAINAGQTFTVQSTENSPATAGLASLITTGAGTSIGGTGVLSVIGGVRLAGGIYTFAAASVGSIILSAVTVSASTTINGVVGGFFNPGTDCNVAAGQTLSLLGGTVIADTSITGPGTIQLGATTILTNVVLGTTTVFGPASAVITTLTTPLHLVSGLATWVGTLTLAAASTGRLTSGALMIASGGATVRLNGVANAYLGNAQLHVLGATTLTINSIAIADNAVVTATGALATSVLNFAGTTQFGTNSELDIDIPITSALTVSGGSYQFMSTQAILQFGSGTSLTGAHTIVTGGAVNNFIVPGSSTVAATLTVASGTILNGTLTGAGSVVLTGCTVGTGLTVSTTTILGPTVGVTTYFDVAAAFQLTPSAIISLPRLGSVGTPFAGTVSLLGTAGTLSLTTAVAGATASFAGNSGTTIICSTLTYGIPGFSSSGTVLVQVTTSLLTSPLTLDPVVPPNFQITGTFGPTCVVGCTIQSPVTLGTTINVPAGQTLQISGGGPNTLLPTNSIVLAGANSNFVMSGSSRAAGSITHTGAGAASVALNAPTVIPTFQTLTVSGSVTAGSSMLFAGNSSVSLEANAVLTVDVGTVVGAGVTIASVEPAVVAGTVNLFGSSVLNATITGLINVNMPTATVNVPTGCIKFVRGAITGPGLGQTLTFAVIDCSDTAIATYIVPDLSYAGTVNINGCYGTNGVSTFLIRNAAATAATAAMNCYGPGLNITSSHLQGTISIGTAGGTSLLTFGSQTIDTSRTLSVLALDAGTVLLNAGNTLISASATFNLGGAAASSSTVILSGNSTLSSADTTAVIGLLSTNVQRRRSIGTATYFGSFVGPALGSTTTLPGTISNTLTTLNNWVGTLVITGTGDVVFGAASVVGSTAVLLMSASTTLSGAINLAAGSPLALASDITVTASQTLTVTSSGAVAASIIPAGAIPTPSFILMDGATLNIGDITPPAIQLTGVAVIVGPSNPTVVPTLGLLDTTIASFSQLASYTGVVTGPFDGCVSTLPLPATFGTINAWSGTIVLTGAGALSVTTAFPTGVNPVLQFPTDGSVATVDGSFVLTPIGVASSVGLTLLNNASVTAGKNWNITVAVTPMLSSALLATGPQLLVPANSGLSLGGAVLPITLSGNLTAAAATSRLSLLSVTIASTTAVASFAIGVVYGPAFNVTTTLPTPLVFASFNDWTGTLTLTGTDSLTIPSGSVRPATLAPTPSTPRTTLNAGTASLSGGTITLNPLSSLHVLSGTLNSGLTIAGSGNLTLSGCTIQANVAILTTGWIKGPRVLATTTILGAASWSSLLLWSGTLLVGTSSPVVLSNIEMTATGQLITFSVTVPPTVTLQSGTLAGAVSLAVNSTLNVNSVTIASTSTITPSGALSDPYTVTLTGGRVVAGAVFAGTSYSILTIATGATVESGVVIPTTFPLSIRGNVTLGVFPASQSMTVATNTFITFDSYSPAGITLTSFFNVRAPCGFALSPAAAASAGGAQLVIHAQSWVQRLSARGVASFDRVSVSVSGAPASQLSLQGVVGAYNGLYLQNGASITSDAGIQFTYPTAVPAGNGSASTIVITASDGMQESLTFIGVPFFDFGTTLPGPLFILGVCFQQVTIGGAPLGLIPANAVLNQPAYCGNRMCGSSPCMNGATCTDLGGAYTCTCAAGFRGERCQTDFNECASNPCRNGGTCIDRVSAFSCNCTIGFAGTRCQTDVHPCVSSPCSNGATCVDSANAQAFSCVCVSGYSGLLCRTNINECASSPCLNGGTCVDKLNGWDCQCHYSYAGVRCQTALASCASQPCMNAGTCVDTGGGNFTCNCRLGYTGRLCQTDRNECASNPCASGATCVDGLNQFSCTCPHGSIGALCDTLVNACQSNNGGCDSLTTCFDFGNGKSSCGKCPFGYDGTGNTTCVDINECETADGGCLTETGGTGSLCVNYAGHYRCLPFIWAGSLLNVETGERGAIVLSNNTGSHVIEMVVYNGLELTYTNASDGSALLVTTVMDVRSLTLRFGASGDAAAFGCRAVAYMSPTAEMNQTVHCSLSPSVGSQLFFSLFPASLLAAPLYVSTAAGGDWLSNLPPTITDFTLRIGANASSYASGGAGFVQPSNTLSSTIGFDGTGFLDDPVRVHVYYGPVGITALSSLAVCALAVADTTVSMIVCNTADFSVGIHNVFTVVAGDQSVTGNDFIVFPVAPTIQSVSGCTDVNNATINCPCEGGIPITISGENFLSPIVLIGGSTCGQVVVNVAGTQLVCVLPVGSGTLKSVSIQSGTGQFSTPLEAVSYAAPTLAFVRSAGCTSIDAFTIVSCVRAGGITLTLSGLNFGVSGAQILIGSVLCSGVVHDPGTVRQLNRGLSCTLPQGTELSRPVLVIQGGSIGPSNATVSYSQCPAGSIQHGTDLNCTACRNGTFSAVQGLTTCQSCASGTAAPNSGQSTCAVCAAGKSSIAAASSCTNCTAGLFQTTAGQSSCNPCAAGQFADSSGLSACALCAAGTTSIAGSSTCTNCTLGLFQSAAGQLSCLSCPSGTFGGSTGLSICSECLAGTSNPLPGKTSCPPCATGTYADNNNLDYCKPCQSGRFANVTGSTVCLSCPVGTHQVETGRSVCLECGPGTANNVPGAVLCQDCDNGKYSDVNSSVTCKPCPIGRAELNSGSTSCPECAIGTYAASSSLSVCLPCSAGSWNNITGQSTCQSCGYGELQVRTGSTACELCVAGSYNGAFAQLRCTGCSPGTYTSTNGSQTCGSCGPGFSQPGFGESSCVACGVGTYTADPGKANCKECDSGQFANVSQLSSCFKCPEGTYQDSSGASSCIECAIGKNAPTEGLASCKLCGVGTAAPGTGSTACDDCQPGKSQLEQGLGVCNPCEAGKVMLTTAAKLCTDCVSGRYQPDEGQTVCTQCPVGRFQSQTGHSSCVNCEPGTYAAIPGLTVCTDCTPGSYQPHLNATSCSLCPVKTYAPSSRQASCEDCPRGSFQLDEGSSKCDICKSGEYQIFTDDLTIRPCLGCPAVGAICISGTIQAVQGYFFSIDASTGQVAAMGCLPGYCAGWCGGDNETSAALSGDGGSSSTNSSSTDGGNNSGVYQGGALSLSTEATVLQTCCGANRPPAAVNPMCGSCNPGYTQTNFACVPCEKANVYLLLFYVGVLWVCVTIFHQISASANPDTKICSYFAQFCLLFLGTDFTNASWLSIFNFNINDTASTCAYPFTPVQRLCMGFVIAVLCFMLLWFNYCIHRLAAFSWKWRARVRAAADLVAANGHAHVSVVRITPPQPIAGTLTVTTPPAPAAVATVVSTGVAGATVSAAPNGSSGGPAGPSQSGPPGAGPPPPPIETPPQNPLHSSLARGHAASVVGGSAIGASGLKPTPPLRDSPGANRIDMTGMSRASQCFVFVFPPHVDIRLFVRTSMALFLFFYTSITLTCFQFFDCVRLQEGSAEHFVVSAYPAILCTDPEYVKLRSVFFVLLTLVVVGFPLAALLFLVVAHRKGWARTREFRRSFGTIFEMYTERAYWWEAVIIVRRIGSVGLSVLLSNPSLRAYRYTWLAVANLTFLIMHMSVHPYRHAQSNLAETVSLGGLCLVTVLIAPTTQPLSQFELIGISLLAYVFLISLFSWMVVQRIHRFRAAQQALAVANALAAAARAAEGLERPLSASASGGLRSERSPRDMKAFGADPVSARYAVDTSPNGDAVQVQVHRLGATPALGPSVPLPSKGTHARVPSDLLTGKKGHARAPSDVLNKSGGANGNRFIVDPPPLIRRDATGLIRQSSDYAGQQSAAAAAAAAALAAAADLRDGEEPDPEDSMSSDPPLPVPSPHLSHLKPTGMASLPIRPNGHLHTDSSINSTPMMAPRPLPGRATLAAAAASGDAPSSNGTSSTGTAGGAVEMSNLPGSPHPNEEEKKSTANRAGAAPPHSIFGFLTSSAHNHPTIKTSSSFVSSTPANADALALVASVTSPGGTVGASAGAFTPGFETPGTGTYTPGQAYRMVAASSGGVLSPTAVDFNAETPAAAHNRLATLNGATPIGGTRPSSSSTVVAPGVNATTTTGADGSTVVSVSFSPGSSAPLANRPAKMATLAIPQLETIESASNSARVSARRDSTTKLVTELENTVNKLSSPINGTTTLGLANIQRVTFAGATPRRGENDEYSARADALAAAAAAAQTGRSARPGFGPGEWDQKSFEAAFAASAAARGTTPSVLPPLKNARNRTAHESRGGVSTAGSGTGTAPSAAPITVSTPAPPTQSSAHTLGTASQQPPQSASTMLFPLPATPQPLAIAARLGIPTLSAASVQLARSAVTPESRGVTPANPILPPATAASKNGAVMSGAGAGSTPTAHKRASPSATSTPRSSQHAGYDDFDGYSDSEAHTGGIGATHIPVPALIVVDTPRSQLDNPGMAVAEIAANADGSQPLLPGS